MSPHLTRIAQGYASTPEGAAFLAKVRVFLAKSQPERSNVLKRTIELARKNQWKEAETTLHTTLDKLHGMTVFLTPDEWRQIHEPFEQVTTSINTALTTIRAQESEAILQTRRKTLTPAMDELLQQCGAVAQGLAKSATVELEGEMVGGPRALSALLTRGQQVHVQVQKYHALTIAINDRLSAGGAGGMLPLSGGVVSVDPIVARYAGGFSSQFAGAIAQVIEADAARAADDEVPALYRAYLQALALTAMRHREASFTNACHGALQKLLVRSPAFAADVAAYEDSTVEILRWRQRVAESQARARLATHPLVEKAFRSAFTSKDNYRGLFEKDMPDYNEPRLLAAAPDILLPALEQVIGQKVSVSDVRGIGTGKNAVTVMNARTYGTLRGVRSAAEPAIAALKADLFVTEESGPLTLPAAAAVASAEMGDWNLCGGTLNGLHLEAFVTRLAAMPDPAWPLVPLGSVPTAGAGRMESSVTNALLQAVVRFDVGPEWVQHQYFVADIASESATASNHAGWKR